MNVTYREQPVAPVDIYTVIGNHRQYSGEIQLKVHPVGYPECLNNITYADLVHNGQVVGSAVKYGIEGWNLNFNVKYN